MQDLPTRRSPEQADALWVPEAAACCSSNTSAAPRLLLEQQGERPV